MLSWLLGGFSQRQTMTKASPSFGQPRPISRLGRAGRPYRHGIVPTVPDHRAELAQLGGQPARHAGGLLHARERGPVVPHPRLAHARLPRGDLRHRVHDLGPQALRCEPGTAGGGRLRVDEHAVEADHDGRLDLHPRGWGAQAADGDGG